ncbi:MAG: DUF86 domain-containing protein [Acidobacteria bacterium]|nr:DUF86 domain-containing protein [Acidobacteriota bacterium]
MRHIRDAAALAVELVRDRTRDDQRPNTMLALSLARCPEIMGEAATKITEETRVNFPRIPFVKMISMRNRLIHAYFDLNLDIVWTTVNDDLPVVISALESALRGEDQPGAPDR